MFFVLDAIVTSLLNSYRYSYTLDCHCQTALQTIFKSKINTSHRCSVISSNPLKSILVHSFQPLLSNSFSFKIKLVSLVVGASQLYWLCLYFVVENHLTFDKCFATPHVGERDASITQDSKLTFLTEKDQVSHLNWASEYDHWLGLARHKQLRFILFQFQNRSLSLYLNVPSPFDDLRSSWQVF